MTPLPDDFDTGSYLVLDERDAMIAQLKAQIDSLIHELNAALKIKNLSRAELVELTDVIGNTQEHFLTPDPDRVAV